MSERAYRLNELQDAFSSILNAPDNHLRYLKDATNLLDLQPLQCSYSICIGPPKFSNNKMDETPTGEVCMRHPFIRSKYPLWVHLRLLKVDEDCLLKFSEKDEKKLDVLLHNDAELPPSYSSVDGRVFKVQKLQMMFQLNQQRDLSHLLDIQPLESTFSYRPNSSTEAQDKKKDTPTGQILETHCFAPSMTPLSDCRN